ncbi:U-box domain-containing protein 7 [Hordeum vulgare]|nr:U-box domain-containing protein 7 [Hordeum vulgare]
MANATSNSVAPSSWIACMILSALDVNKPIIGTSGAVPFLVHAFEAAATKHVRHDALRFSTSPSRPASATHLLSAGLGPSLVAAIEDMSASDCPLPVLSNIVAACPAALYPLLNMDTELSEMQWRRRLQ